MKEKDIIISRIKYQINLFIFLLFSFSTKNYICNIQVSYPKVLILNNGNIFLANIEGMFICDPNFETIIKPHSYNGDISSYNLEFLMNNVLIVQFPEPDGFIICLVASTFYYFDSNGDFLSSFSTDLNYQDSLFNLLPYKKDNDYYHYIITIISNDLLNIQILHYKTNTVNNELVCRKTFIPFYLDFPRIKLKNQYMGCQIMNSQKKGKVLTCCFQGDNYDLMIIQSFIIEKNLQEFDGDIHARIESPEAKHIHCIVSHDGKHLFCCYYQHRNTNGYCLIYDIDTNKITSNEPLMDSCEDQYSKTTIIFYLLIKQMNMLLFVRMV